MRKYPFVNVDPRVIQQAVQLWNTKLTTSQIASKMGKGRSTICLYLKHAGVNMKNRRYSKYTLDEQYFDTIDTSEKAYWLGFLLADGCIRKNELIVELQTRDASHLMKLTNALDFTGPIKQCKHKDTRSGKTHGSARLTVCSKKLTTTLRNAGWVEFKNEGNCQILINTPSILWSDCLRGLFDGDGSLVTHKKSGDLHFTLIDAHREVVHWCMRVLVAFISLNRVKIYPTKNKTAHVLHYGGNRQVPRIMKYLDGNPKLNRKWLNFELWEVFAS